MNLTVLGSGTTTPHKSRASSGYWLETVAGSLMLDMSATAFHNAAREGFDWDKIRRRNAESHKTAQNFLACGVKRFAQEIRRRL
jgi:hypothetical protein